MTKSDVWRAAWQATICKRKVSSPVAPSLRRSVSVSSPQSAFHPSTGAYYSTASERGHTQYAGEGNWLWGACCCRRRIHMDSAVWDSGVCVDATGTSVPLCALFLAPKYSTNSAPLSNTSRTRLMIAPRIPPAVQHEGGQMWNKSVGHRRQVLTVNEHLANEGPGDTSLAFEIREQYLSTLRYPQEVRHQ